MNLSMAIIDILCLGAPDLAPTFCAGDLSTVIGSAIGHVLAPFIAGKIRSFCPRSLTSA